MSNGPPDPIRMTWQRQLATAVGCAAGGVVVHVASPLLPSVVSLLGLGIGILGAGFLLGWAADAGEAVFSGGPVLAVVALVTVLPEFVIEIRFAFIQAAELVTANLTGATRLLLAGALTLPLAVALMAKRHGVTTPEVTLGTNRRLEIGVLLLSALFAVQLVIRGNVSVFDGVLLIALYGVYTRRVQGVAGEEPAVVGVPAGLVALPQRIRRPSIAGIIGYAGLVVLLIANPFADALLAVGVSAGFDPYLLIQSVVPIATEAPEFVVVGVLIANHRPAQGLALFLSSAVSQWTFAFGALPLAYSAGGGGLFLPLAAREQLELVFTIAFTLFAVAALCPLRIKRQDAVLAAVVFVVQLAYPSPFIRLAASFVMLVFAIDLLVAHRRHLGPCLRSVWPRRRGPQPEGGLPELG